MYSFYGGRPGNSFVIVTTYRSIDDMVQQFKKGPNYTAVHYDEYVMINAVSKSDPNNGKIFRRGYDFTNANGGAQYIGQITGPAGTAPQLSLTTVQNAKGQAAEAKAIGYGIQESEGDLAMDNYSLVPGKTASGVFNDKIHFYSCSITRDGEESLAYIGFIIPYTVIDFESSVVEPYDFVGQYRDTTSVTRVDNYTHPFYEKWHINIPKGIPGGQAKNLKVQKANNNVEPYNGKSDDINKKRDIITYDYYTYDTEKNGTKKTYYLGDYNMIKNITVDNNNLIINYTHNDSDSFPLSFNYEYHDGDEVRNLSWIGVGRILDNENNNKKIIFDISPSASIDREINKVTVMTGVLTGTNGINIINNLSLSTPGTTTVTKTFTGLRFEVDSGIESGAATADFINLSISNLGLRFNKV